MTPLRSLLPVLLLPFAFAVARSLSPGDPARLIPIDLGPASFWKELYQVPPSRVIQHLRTAGAPAEFVRVVAEHLIDHTQESAEPSPKPAAGGVLETRRAELHARLDRARAAGERRHRLQGLLGADYAFETPAQARSRKQLFGAISITGIDRISDINLQWLETECGRVEALGPIEDAAQARRECDRIGRDCEKARLDDIENGLTEAERFDYRRLQTRTGRTIRGVFGGIELTRAEFEALYRILTETDDRVGAFDGPPSARLAFATSVSRETGGAIRALLGDERYARHLEKVSRSFAWLRACPAARDLDAARALAAWSALEEAKSACAQMDSDRTGAIDVRQARLVDVRRTLESALSAILPNDQVEELMRLEPEPWMEAVRRSQ